jgi:hypothetical protein
MESTGFAQQVRDCVARKRMKIAGAVRGKREFFPELLPTFQKDFFLI